MKSRGRRGREVDFGWSIQLLAISRELAGEGTLLSNHPAEKAPKPNPPLSQASESSRRLLAAVGQIKQDTRQGQQPVLRRD